MMFMFGRRGGFRRIGPAGIAFGLFRAWRRLSPDQKSQIKSRARTVSAKLRPRSGKPTAVEH